jgi:hypothetical protein
MFLNALATAQQHCCGAVAGKRVRFVPFSGGTMQPSNLRGVGRVEVHPVHCGREQALRDPPLVEQHS